MDANDADYLFRTPATDLFRKVSMLEVDTPDGIIPLENIMEIEVRERVKNIIGEYVKLGRSKEWIQQRLKAEALNIKGMSFPETIPIVSHEFAD